MDAESAVFGCRKDFINASMDAGKISLVHPWMQESFLLCIHLKNPNSGLFSVHATVRTLDALHTAGCPFCFSVIFNVVIERTVAEKQNHGGRKTVEER